MIKVNLQTLEATREILPNFLRGLKQESLNDLGWTDQALGVNNFGWWVETDVTSIDHITEKYDGTESYVADLATYTVSVTKGVVAKTTEEINETLSERRKPQLDRLQEIFNDKTTGLKKLAIDKPYMTNSEAINNQYRVYEEMYKNAKAGRYDEVTNAEIITANETVKAQLAELTLLLNSVRAVIETNIMSDTSEVEALLNTADGITLTIAELTPTKLGEIKTAFGL